MYACCLNLFFTIRTFHLSNRPDFMYNNPAIIKREVKILHTDQSGKSRYIAAFKAAFPYTVPIFAGFWFLGLTYGIYMNVSGFSFWYPMLMSLTIFAGSVEFVAVNLLMGAFNPLQALAMTLMINARHRLTEFPCWTISAVSD